MAKCEAYLMNRDRSATPTTICGEVATVTYFDCCGNYHGTPMCDACAAVDQRESVSCEDAEIVPLTA